MSSDTLLYVNASNYIIIIFYFRVSFILHLHFVERNLQKKKHLSQLLFFKYCIQEFLNHLTFIYNISHIMSNFIFIHQSIF